VTWLSETSEAIARSCELEPARYALSEEDATVLLELAGLAAHSSGDRTNAPLLCHVVGMMRADGADLALLAGVVRAELGA
jgi:hypothetical protein